MEMIGGSNSDDVVHATVHWSNSENVHDYAGSQRTIGNPEEYHIYELEWDEKEITLRVDGETIYSKDISGTTYSEFHQPFYILLNLAIGGNWGGYPDGPTSFPQYFLIDWIRVYQ